MTMTYTEVSCHKPQGAPDLSLIISSEFCFQSGEEQRGEAARLTAHTLFLTSKEERMVLKKGGSGVGDSTGGWKQF